jgi:hypothetical protein
MNQIEAPNQPKRSLGKLRKVEKTKPKSPDMAGELRLRKHTLRTLAQQFDETHSDEVPACLAAWKNYDADGPYLTIELPPNISDESIVRRGKILYLSYLTMMRKHNEAISKSATGFTHWISIATGAVGKH